jgi:hypothetical protein
MQILKLIASSGGNKQLFIIYKRIFTAVAMFGKMKRLSSLLAV